MRTATALVQPPPTARFGRHEEPESGQIPLPFPGVKPVLPVPIERGDARAISERSARFMQALVEVLAGVRPPRQMAAWMAPDVYAQLTSRLDAHVHLSPFSRPNNGTRSGPRIVSVHVFMVNDHTAEIAGRMVHRGRSRAIAVRLELQTSHRGHQTWRCTALSWA